MRAIAVISLVLAAGCITEPKVESTKQWEGHYFSVDDAKKAADSIQLDKGESIWIMSNYTLNRLLKNTRK